MSDPFYFCDLEIRARGASRVIRGAFPYGKMATVSDRGRVRKERFGAGAFSWQIEEFAKLSKEASDKVGKLTQARMDELQEQLARRNVNLLSGHEYSKPIASLRAGSLELKDSPKALSFEATLPSDDKQPSWVRDTVLAIENGLATGISPGFRVPPASTVSNAEELIPEPNNPGVMIRQINQAVLFELSIATRPAYAGTTVDVRDDVPTPTPRRRIWL